jgi:molybdopterin synthase sulfur carrier subunit
LGDAVGNFQRQEALSLSTSYAILSEQGIMRVTVKLFATLREGRFFVDTLEFKAGTTVTDVVRYLDISEQEAALTFINSRHVSPSTALANGDTLAIFPPVGGG